MIMKVTVDQTRCDTTGRCVQLAPELFRFQIGSKKAVERQRDVPVRLHAKCLQAAAECPRGAIIVAQYNEHAGRHHEA